MKRILPILFTLFVILIPLLHAASDPYLMKRQTMVEHDLRAKVAPTERR